MPLKVIKSLDAWSSNARPGQRLRGRASVSWARVYSLPVPVEVRWASHGLCLTRYGLATSADGALSEDDTRAKWVVNEAHKSATGMTKEEQEAMAICEVLRFDGEDAECSVKMPVPGYELPCVSFPARLLRAKNLSEGSRFLWIMQDSNSINLADIDAEIPQAAPQLPADQQAELESLYEDSRRRAAEGEDWTEDTGPGQ